MTDPNYLGKQADEFLKSNDPSLKNGIPLEIFAQQEFEKSIRPTDTDRIDTRGRLISGYIGEPKPFVESSEALSKYKEPEIEKPKSMTRPRTARFDLRNVNKGTRRRAILDDLTSGHDIL